MNGRYAQCNAVCQMRTSANFVRQRDLGLDPRNPAPPPDFQLGACTRGRPLVSCTFCGQLHHARDDAGLRFCLVGPVNEPPMTTTHKR